VVRRKAVSGSARPAVPAVVRDVLRSPGEPLDTATRALLEPRFGHDFSRVRVHADARAGDSARAVDALAYTAGPHVVFARGRFDPGSPGGLRLLSHELAHVAQQAPGRWAIGLPSDLEIGHPAAPEEAHADAVAADVVEGRAPSTGRRGAPGPVLRRAPARNTLRDCTAAQEKTIGDAMSRALSDLDSAIATLAARPLSEHAQNAMFLALRRSDDKAADDTLAALRKVRAGLPGVTIECDQPEDVNLVCGGETAAATNLITGVVHLCMGDWDSSDNVKENPRTLVHEGAHGFGGAPGAGQDPYFDSSCDESADTAAWGPGGRIGKADPLACVVFHLTHRTADEAKELKQLQSGEALSKIVQTLPRGPISLGGSEKKPAFILSKAPAAGGFTFRWRLFDDSDRHYLMRGRESDRALDWLSFTDQASAIIGAKTRGLLARRGVRKGVVECTVRIPVLKGGKTGTEDKTLRLDVEFTE
jgi:hypothetical protein